jgi:hypothetical protein
MLVSSPRTGGCVRTRSFGSHPGRTADPSASLGMTNIDLTLSLVFVLRMERLRSTEAAQGTLPSQSPSSNGSASLPPCHPERSRGICSAPRMAPKASGSHIRTPSLGREREPMRTSGRPVNRGEAARPAWRRCRPCPGRRAPGLERTGLSAGGSTSRRSCVFAGSK